MASYTHADTHWPRGSCFAGALALVLLCGCVHLERFSNRATDFNVQVADAQNKTLLLNILRAANRFPMHFTELTTLSGTGTLTVGGTVTIPVGVLNGGSATGSIAPTATLAETPTFNVAVLETQEFYNGMLKSLKLDQVANFINEGMPPEVVYTMIFGRLIYQRDPASAPIYLENNFHPLKPLEPKELCPSMQVGWKGKPALDANNQTLTPVGSEHECFKDVLNALKERGLSLEPFTETSDVGTLIDENSFNDPKLISELGLQELKVRSVRLEDCDKKTAICPDGIASLSNAQQRKLREGALLYRLQKEEKGTRFCFDVSPGDAPPVPAQAMSIGDRIRAATIPKDSICRDRMPKDDKTGKAAARSKRGKTPASVTLKYQGEEFTLEAQLRSAEGLVYYLGEIARCDLKLDDKSRCSPVNVVAYEGECEARLFQVHQAGEAVSMVPCPNKQPPRAIPIPMSDAGRIAADSGGRTYWINIDPGATDRSGAVLRMVSQLLALNRSAKDLPAPAIVPILAR